MTAQMISGLDVRRPVPDPITSTLLDHATVVENTRHFGLTNNEGLWPSYNCLDLMTPTEMCPDVRVGPKVFTAAGWVPAFEFAVYGGVQCLAVGLDADDQQAETERVFDLNEAKGIERTLLLTRFLSVPAVPGSDDPLNPAYATWTLPVDLTPVGAVSLLVALALLEGHAAANYAGLPTIHMPRAAATILEANGAIKWEGDLAYTKNGSKVAIGGGYDDPEMLASGLWDMFATGEVYVERGAKRVIGPLNVLPGDGSGIGSDMNGLSDNTVVSFVERPYRVAIDCYAAKITATAFA